MTKSGDDTGLHAWVDALPGYVGRVLCLGAGPWPSERLEARGIAASYMRKAGEAPSPALENFDAIVICDETPLAEWLAEALRAALPLLHGDGAVYLPAGEGERMIEEAALAQYGESSAGWAIAVRKGYDPAEHARRLFAAGRPDVSYTILDGIPSGWADNPEAQLAIAMEKQLSLYAWDRAAGDVGRAGRFFRAQKEFYTAVYVFPELSEVYQCQAEFWRLLGNDDMAARLLRSIQHAAPDEQAAQRLLRCRPEAVRRTPEPPPPEWSGTWRPRILIVTHRHSDYGMDTLCHGLCLVLGDEHVVEYPWKPTLHGARPEDAGAYPCVFNHAGESRTLDAVTAELRRGDYDVVLYADMLQDVSRQDARRLMDAAGETPLFLVDTWDDCGNHQNVLLEYLGLPAFQAYFKREMLACVDYGPNTYPLPFGYPDERIPEHIAWERRQGCFWAGSRIFGLRRLYLERAAGLAELPLNRVYSQAEYVKALAEAEIGLCLFGLGFDTVRYWELPAHGCMLLAERPPIRIPHDFEDGVSAVFFDDLPDLESKLVHFAAHPDEARPIAASGHEHLRRYHTASARARQLLGRIEAALHSGARTA